MTRTLLRTCTVLFSLGLLLPLMAQARVSAEQAAQLQGTLTPFGAERQGDAAKGIPQWTGGMTQPPAGYGGPGSFHVDPYAEETPLRVIDASTMQADADNLSDGVKALLKAYPQTFKLPVYPSHRSFSAPEDIYRNTAVNAQQAELSDSGYGLVGAYGGIPFPIPADGREAIWNHIARWQARYTDEVAVTAQVTTSGSYSLLRERIQLLSSYYDPKKDAGSLGNRLYYFASELLPPSRDVGRALLVHEPIDRSPNHARRGSTTPASAVCGVRRPWPTTCRSMASTPMTPTCTTVPPTATTGSWSASVRCWCRTTTTPWRSRAWTPLSWSSRATSTAT